MALNELTITLSDPDGRVSIDTLKDGLEKALAMIRSIESGFTTGTIRWEVIRVRMRSPLRLTIAPYINRRAVKGVGRKIVQAVVIGVGVIEQKPVAPKHFNEEALRATKELVSIAKKEGATVTLEAGKKKVTLTEQAARHVDEVVAKARHYHDVSTVEGTLEVVSVHDHPSFFVYETLTGNRVECFVAEDKLRTYATMLNKRVAVTGRVKYTNHVPRTVEVESIRALPGASESLRLEGIPPINITDGVPPEEHVRRLRDA